MPARLGKFCLLGGLFWLSALSTSALEGPVAPWGAKLKVSPMTLNSAGSVSWINLANPGDLDMTVTCNAFWQLADGTKGSISGYSFPAVTAGAFAKISEVQLLDMMGNPVQLVEASIELIVNNPDIRYSAVMRASDGRIPISCERVFLLEAPAAPAP